MNCKVVIQTRPNGEKHIAFSSSPITCFEDLHITAPEWADAKLVEETIVIVASDKVLDALGTDDFRTIPSGGVVAITKKEGAQLKENLMRHYGRDLQS